MIGNGGTSGSISNSAVTDTGTLVFNRSDYIADNQVISGAGAVTQSGSGTLFLSNTANTYTGITTISSGILSVNTLANGGSNSGIGKATNVAANLVFTNGVLQFTGASANSTDHAYTITAASTGGFDSSGSAALTITGALTAPGSATVTLSGFDPAANNITGVISGSTTNVTKSGLGYWQLNQAANTYGGVTTIGGPSLIAGNEGVGILNVTTLAAGGSNSSIGNSNNTAGNLVFNGGILQYTGTAAGTTDRNFTLNVGTSGGFDASGTTAGVLTIGTSGSSAVGSMTAPGSSGSQTFILTGTGTGTAGQGIMNGTINNGTSTNVTNLTKLGTGTWILNNSGASSFSGVTNINGGTLQIGNADAQGSLGSTSGVTDNGTLTFNRSDAMAAFSTVISGGGAVTVNGGGTSSVTFTGTNTYIGTTTVAASSVLNIGNGTLASALASYNIADAGTIQFNSPTATTVTVAGNISGAGAITQNSTDSTSILALTGVNSYSGATNLTKGTLRVFDYPAVLGTAPVNITTGSSNTLDLRANSNVAFTTGLVTLNGLLCRRGDHQRAEQQHGHRRQCGG